MVDQPSAELLAALKEEQYFQLFSKELQIALLSSSLSREIVEKGRKECRAIASDLKYISVDCSQEQVMGATTFF